MDDGASKHVALRAERVKTPSFRISHCVMDLAARDFASVDLRGLGPALRAHAKARGITVSAVIRQAIATQLETHAPGLDDHAVTDGEENEIVKLTIRLEAGAAARMSTAARSRGLSRGAYLASLVKRTPAPPLAITAELGRSTEQLAIISGDMNELIRTLGRGGVLSGPLLDDWVRPLLDDVRRHVGIASRLVAELRPARALPGQRAVRPAATVEARP